MMVKVNKSKNFSIHPFNPRGLYRPLAKRDLTKIRKSLERRVDEHPNDQKAAARLAAMESGGYVPKGLRKRKADLSRRIADRDTTVINVTRSNNKMGGDSVRRAFKTPGSMQ